MKNITTLTNLLSELKGCTGVSIIYRSNVRHNKTSRVDGSTWFSLFGAKEIVKRQTLNSNVGANYTNAVNNQQKREGGEGTFTAESLPYGSWIVPNVLLDNGKGELQLRAYRDMGICSSNDKQDYFWSSGETVTPSEWSMVQPFLAPVTDGAEHQEVDKAVKPRNLNLSRVESIVINGTVLF